MARPPSFPPGYDKSRAYRERHKEALAEKRKATAAARNARQVETRKDPTQWPRVALWTLRHRAKNRGLEMNVDETDLAVPEFCPVLGIRIVPGSEHEHERPSVDRFDNTKGYTKGNVRVISNRANSLKRDATLDEIEAVARYLRGDV